MSITVKKAYKPHAKESGKEVHIGDGEKGVAHSYLGVNLSKGEAVQWVISVLEIL